ncbi:MAG TPA: MFS transporter [Streptosporangiaceae bacterium]|nr:MFS transporter [Streptosporangiaceae bacterium]
MHRSAAGRATAIVFLAMGVMQGTLSSRWPWIAGQLHLDSGVIGAVSLASTAGALVAMPLAARFVHRYGARPTTCVLTAASGATLVLPAFAPDVAVLAVAFVLMGAAVGTQDNAMNTAGVEAENGIGRSIMSGLHGMWSVGLIVGGLAGSVAARAGVDPRVQFTVTGVIIAVTGVITQFWLAGDAAPRPAAGLPGTGAPEVHVPRFAWPHGLLLLIGLVAFAAIFVEYAAVSWAALFMHWTMHTSQAEAALATALFALTMAAGRLCGDAIVARIGPVYTVRACGVLGTAGCLLVAVAPAAAAALAGFMLIGAGVSVVVPLAFATAGHSGQSPAVSVAGVATVSYGAGLVAPTVIGGVADLSSLRVSFAVAALVAVMVAAGAGLMGQAAAHGPVPRAQEPASSEAD